MKKKPKQKEVNTSEDMDLESAADPPLLPQNLPSVTSHCAVLIIDVYFALCSSDTNSESSNSG